MQGVTRGKQSVRLMPKLEEKGRDNTATLEVVVKKKVRKGRGRCIRQISNQNKLKNTCSSLPV